MLDSWMVAGIDSWWDSVSPRTKYVLTFILLVVVLLLGALVVALVTRWRRQTDTCERLSANEQLAHFRSLYEQGVLSPEEFERLRGLLGEQLRQEMDVQAPPEGPVQAPPQLPNPPGDSSQSV